MKLNKISLLLIFFLLLSVFQAGYASEKIVVITHINAPIDRLNTTEVANVYMGIGAISKHLKPFDRKDKYLRRLFYRATTKLSISRVHAYWTKKVFTGKGKAPKMLTSSKMRQTLSNDQHAITYVF